jgi:phage terminase large subunit
MPEVQEIRLLPHQYEFVVSDDPWLLSDGGRGSGKTRGMATKIAMRAQNPGAREGVYRQKLIDLRTTLIRTMLEGDGVAPPVLTPGTYTHNQTTKTIKMHGGGEIVYNGMDQGDVSRQFGSTGRGSSMNLSGAWFEEWVEIPEPVMLQIALSVRLKIPGMTIQKGGICNPASDRHYLARRFGIAAGSEPEKGHRRIVAPASQNWHNPPEFFDELRALTGVARERYWFGKWVGSDGLVFDRWNRDVHVREDSRPPKRLIIGVDSGYTDPFAAVRLHIDSDRRMHASEEVYETQLTPTEQVARVAAMVAGEEATVVVDSAEPGLIEMMNRAGLHAVPAQKGKGSIMHGIQLIQDRLTVQGDKLPRFTVDPVCVNLIREFESYEWKPDAGGVLRDRPKDGDDHMPDAVRYATMHLDGGVAAEVEVFDSQPVSPAADERMWQTC